MSSKSIARYTPQIKGGAPYHAEEHDGGLHGQMTGQDFSDFEFDADNLTQVIAEQRARIAAVAGVHPSKVRIRFYH